MRGPEPPCCPGPPVAIVGRRPDGDQLGVEHELVALHDQLVSSCDKLHLVGLVEIGADVAAKQVTSTPRAEAPPETAPGDCELQEMLDWPQLPVELARQVMASLGRRPHLPGLMGQSASWTSAA